MSKLLAIDDDKNNLALIKATMKKYIPECEVILSSSGTEGVELARKESPDVILLDVMMPVMNGYEACEILKADGLTKHIPIIFFSAYVKDSIGVIKGLDLGADAFLKKPVDPSEMAAQVKVMLRIKNVEDELRNEMQKYKVMAETLPDAVITFNLNDEITYLSPVAYKLFGFKREKSYINNNVFELLFAGNYEMARQVFNELLVSTTIKDVEFELKGKNDKKFVAELSASLIYDSKNEPVEYILVIKDITKRKQAENDILNYQKNLKSLNTALSEAEEKERRIIAEYLHDGIGQTLSLAYINLSTLSKAKLSKSENETFEKSLELIDNAISETRTLTFDLSPPILFELGLIPALKWKLNQISEKYAYKTDFKSDHSNIEMSSNVRVLIYRIVSELITNVLKHANASFIGIEYFVKGQNLFISVSDNGKGFEYKPDTKLSEKNGFGFFSVKERLDSLEGQMKILSEKQKGSTIKFSIPLKNL